LNFYNNFRNKNLIIAHRGYRAIRAENTLSAFEAAIGKCDFIELDIQVTKDYELVVCHDYTLERTTNINKNSNFAFNGSYHIYDYTLEELKLLDIGNWFIKDDPFGELKNKTVTKKDLKSLPKQTIMTLEDILKFAQKNSIALNIELKDCSYIDDKVFVLKLLDTINALHITIPLLISSFNHNYIKIIKEIDKTMSTAINVEDNYPDDLINYVQSLDIQSYHCAVNIVSSVIIEKLTKIGIIVNVFTVNNKQKQKELYKLGVKSIFTDYI